MRVQVTPLLEPSFVTVAVNGCVPFRATLAGLGETETEIGRIVIAARLKAEVFVTELAWRKTPRKAREKIGGVKAAGAVYVTAAPLVGTTVPQVVQAT